MRGYRSIAGLIFAYESVALITGKGTTLTSYSASHKWAKVALIALLTAHLWPPYVLAGARP